MNKNLTEREQRELEEWDLLHGHDVWEWEHGGGWSVMTHDVAKAQDWVYMSLLRDLGDNEQALDHLPYGEALSRAVRLWVNPKKLEQDFPVEQGHRFWWFGRVPIMLITY
jgi:hypothetical protein